jgi:hypothetical protein
MTSTDSALARFIGLTAITFFVLFVANILAALAPFNPSNPLWLINLCNALINNGFFPLLGLCLLAVGTRLVPREISLKRLRDGSYRFATIPFYGFIFLIPALNYLIWSSFAISASASTARVKGVEQKYGLVRNAINSSSSITELQTKLQALNAPSLPETYQKQTLAEVKSALLANLNQSRSSVLASLEQPKNPKTIFLIGQSLKQSALALIFAATYSPLVRIYGMEKSVFDWLADLRINTILRPENIKRLFRGKRAPRRPRR